MTRLFARRKSVTSTGKRQSGAGIVARFLLRYILLGAAAYGILTSFPASLRGLLVGLEVKPDTNTQRLSDAFLKNGLLTKETRHHTFRFAPPLIIDEALVDEIVARVGRSLQECQ